MASLNEGSEDSTCSFLVPGALTRLSVEEVSLTGCELTLAGLGSDSFLLAMSFELRGRMRLGEGLESESSSSSLLMRSILVVLYSSEFRLSRRWVFLFRASSTS